MSLNGTHPAPEDLPPPQRQGLDDAKLARAVARLQAGQIVAFPTETVYGLGAAALMPAAVERVFALKGRPSINPLIVHVSGVEMAQRQVVAPAAWSAGADRLAQAFWPGPLTMVLEKADEVPMSVTAGRSTVAVRCPDHPAALALLFGFGGPMVGPSANRSGGVSPTCAEHVRAAWTEEEVMVIDGGACSAGIESTVVLLGAEGEPARILRPGPVGAEAIEAVLGRAVTAGPGGSGDAGAGTAGLLGPGMLTQHYAPRARVVLVDDGELPDVLEDAMEDRQRVVVLTHRLTAEADPTGRWTLVAMPGSAVGYASRLYAALREADAAGADLIAIERPPGPAAAESPEDRALWVAVADRLARASAR